MSDSRARCVAASRYLLAFGTVLALAVPAAGVLTLDPGSGAGSSARGAGDASGLSGSLVASHPVTPKVSKYGVPGVSSKGLQALAASPTARARVADRVAALSAPEPVSGFATVGVTWKHGTKLGDNDVTVSVRSLDNGRWSDWKVIPYSAEHAPDPGTREAERARPGTDPIVVGDVDHVQVKAVTASGQAPPDLQLAVVDPGRTSAPALEKPAIDTAKLASAHIATAQTATLAAAQDVTPKPLIYSRAQWGADESMRDKPSLHYYEVHAGFVHHTVDANNYTRAQVPGIIRGIYAYHTQVKGWSDIGYNFLVDRFGRIWEGRYGGVDRPVVGAHTLGYNEYSFAMSAIGNYEIAQPSAAMLDAYGRLFAWKLSLHGVDAASTKQWVGSKYFQAINGHRDAGQTACPGKYLYAQLPKIRALAEQYQQPFRSRSRSTDLAGTHWPDLVVRDRATKRVYVVQTGGQVAFRAGQRAATRWGGMDLVTASRDLTGDHVADMVGRNATTKVTGIYPGDGQGGFGPAPRGITRFTNADQLVATGDLNGDRHNDVVARDRDTHRLYLYRGTGKGGFLRPRLLSSDWSPYRLTLGGGDFTGDGNADLLARRGDGTLWLFPGTGAARLRAPIELPGGWLRFDLLTASGDVTNDGIPDVVGRLRSSGLTYIYPGNGKGGLSARIGPFTQFGSVNFLATAGQVAGTHRADLVGRDDAGRLTQFTNTGRSNIRAVVDSGRTFSRANLVLNVGDWNGDGYGDVVTRSSSGEMFLYRGDGTGHFAAAVRMAGGWGSVNLVAAVGDITGDGYPDLMGQPAGGDMRIYPGNASTGFLPSYVAHAPIASSEQVGVGLWDSDGSPDSILRRSDGSLVLYPGNGPGGLTYGTQVATGMQGYDWLQGVGDVDGDGKPDLLAREPSTGDLWLLPGDGTGLASRRLVGEGFGRFDLVG